jgi:hypothetical protein
MGCYFTGADCILVILLLSRISYSTYLMEALRQATQDSIKLSLGLEIIFIGWA